jgi:chromosome segregation ATPase
VSQNKKRLPRGEAKVLVHQWCDDFVREHGVRPTYTQAQQATGIAAMTFSKPWAEWNTLFNTNQLTQAPSTKPLAPDLPTALLEAWASAVAALDSVKQKELEAEKLVARRELEKVRAEHAALETELKAMQKDCEAVQDEIDEERAVAAAELASVMAAIAERNAALGTIQAELVQARTTLAAQNVELEMVKSTVQKLEDWRDRSEAKENEARIRCQHLQEEILCAKISATRLEGELEVAKQALLAAEATQALKAQKAEELQGTLDALRQELSQHVAELAGTTATIAELRGQLAREAKLEHLLLQSQPDAEAHAMT